MTAAASTLDEMTALLAGSEFLKSYGFVVQKLGKRTAYGKPSAVAPTINCWLTMS